MVQTVRSEWVNGIRNVVQSLTFIVNTKMDKLSASNLLHVVLLLGAALQYADTLVGACEPPTCYEINGVDTPCTSCPIGYGVAVVDGEFRYCQTNPDPRDTDCRPCKEGFFSDVVSPEKKCKVCRPCHQSKEEIVQNCTANNNFVCQCKSGEFFKENDTYCTACGAPCRLDEEEIQACTPDHDRICGPRRTTSPAKTEVTTGVTTKVTTNLTSKPDLNSTTRSGETYDNATPGTGAPTHGNKPDQWPSMWIVGGVVAGCVVLIALIVFIYQCRKRTRNGRVRGGSQQSQPDGSGRLFNILCCVVNSGNNNVHNYVPASSHPNGLPNGHGHRVQNGVVPGAATRQYGMNSGPNISNGHAPAESYDENIPLRSPPVLPEQDIFPAKTREKLIMKLKRENAMGYNWIWFAEKKFHLAPDEMEEWESSRSPGELVLTRWVQEGRSIEEFRRCLKEMERDDILELLPQEGDEEEETGEERELENYASGSSEV